MAVPRRIGLLPGSFNPPHLGHAELARRAVSGAGLDACFFYVNSFNARKRGSLAPIGHRVAMLAALLEEPDLIVLDPAEFADDPGAVEQENVFLPLMAILARRFCGAAEIWLVRGSDNFIPPDRGGYRYPDALRDTPHVVGLRSAEHAALDYSMLGRAIFVETREVSSTAVREDVLHRRAIADHVGSANESYIRDHALFLG